MTEKKPFRIGLCMAGAVSAGAYTAGVMDYLFEALAAWEKKKHESAPNTPQHQVVIPIMGGASAGGMTAMLTATVLNNALIPVQLKDKNERPDKITNKLYDSWVNLIADDMFPELLSNADIKPGQIESLLNSTFIDLVAEKMICCNQEEPWLPTPNFIEKPLKLFTTLSNLEGFKYNTGFNTGDNRQLYNMSVHNDYGCFELFDNSMDAVPRTKGWMPLNFQNDDNVSTAKQAAMATGAFPIGLKARTLHRNAADINEIPFLRSIFTNNKIPDGIVTTLNIDGGTINNEPFEKVREVLDDISKKGKALSQEELNINNCLYQNFENTVIMIDPFPSVEAGKFDPSPAIPNVILKTLSAMLAQMRAKPVTYKAAMISSDASQYIITPSRKIPNRENKLESVFGEKAIACGNLAGFGGFLNKEFREHDYYLGRFNCEIFLRDYFTIPESDLHRNPIFTDGYQNIDLDDFRSTNDPTQIQIIPIFTHKTQNFPMPLFQYGSDWPKITEEDIDRFRHPVRNRIQKLILNMAHWNIGIQILLFSGCQLVLNRIIGNKVLSMIKDDLYDWNLISDYIPESKTSKIIRFKRSKYWKYWTIALVTTFVLIGVFRFPDFHVPGLIRAQYSPNIATLNAIISDNLSITRRHLYLDIVFIIAYSALFYFSGKLLNILGWLTGKRVLLLCLFAGFLDIIENLMLLQIINSIGQSNNYAHFSIFFWIVRLKWVAIGLGIFLVLLVAGKKLFAKAE